MRRSVRLFVNNPDMIHPSPDDGLVPKTGALMSALVQCSGGGPSSIMG